jgi:hypothetical protein
MLRRLRIEFKRETRETDVSFRGEPRQIGRDSRVAESKQLLHFIPRVRPRDFKI